MIESIKIITDNEEFHKLWKRVNEKMGYFSIIHLGGDYNEQLYLATLNDDTKIVFEVYEDEIYLMLTREQKSRDQGLEGTDEDWQDMLEEILLYYLRDIVKMK
jgi:hypothetical protein